MHFNRFKSLSDHFKNASPTSFKYAWVFEDYVKFNSIGEFNQVLFVPSSESKQLIPKDSKHIVSDQTKLSLNTLYSSIRTLCEDVTNPDGTTTKTLYGIPITRWIFDILIKDDDWCQEVVLVDMRANYKPSKHRLEVIQAYQDRINQLNSIAVEVLKFQDPRDPWTIRNTDIASRLSVIKILSQEDSAEYHVAVESALEEDMLKLGFINSDVKLAQHKELYAIVQKSDDTL